MYKILIKIMVLLAGLVLFSARAGAASMSLPPILCLPGNTETMPINNSASSLGYTALHNLPSLIKSSDDFVQTTGDAPVILRSIENQSTATPSLGELDGIAWDKVEQPGYISVISRLVALPAANELWAPVSYSAHTTSLIHNTSILNSQVLSANTTAISHSTIIECGYCHMPQPAQISEQIRGVE